jgi:cytochrome P450
VTKVFINYQNLSPTRTSCDFKSDVRNISTETLRKYPPAIATDRVCIKNYKVPDTDKVIEAGTVLTVPIFGLHRDPEYFPEPELFDPERFNEKNKSLTKPYTYLPFGVGPHNCIGKFIACEFIVGVIKCN